MDKTFNTTIVPSFGVFVGSNTIANDPSVSYPYVSEWMSEEAVTEECKQARCSSQKNTAI